MKKVTSKSRLDDSLSQLESLSDKKIKSKSKSKSEFVRINASSPEEALKQIREHIIKDQESSGKKVDLKDLEETLKDVAKDLEKGMRTGKARLGSSDDEYDDTLDLVSKDKITEMMHEMPGYTNELAEFVTELTYHIVRGNLDEAKGMMEKTSAGIVMALAALCTHQDVKIDREDRDNMRRHVEQMIRTVRHDPKKETMYFYSTEDKKYFLFTDKDDPMKNIDSAIADAKKNGDSQSLVELGKIRAQVDSKGKSKSLN